VRVRPLGSSGLACSELGLGTWGLSGDAYGPVSSDEQERVIARARALGITLFETADVYGNGAMLERLVRVLGKDEHCYIVTKLGTMLDGNPARKRFDPGFLDISLQATIARLQPRSPDVVLLHNPSLDVMLRGEATHFMNQIAARGTVRSWGVSAGSAAVARAAIDAGTPIVELAFNVLWASDVRAIEQPAREKGVGLIARSVLAHGLLCGQWTYERSFSQGDHRVDRWTSEDLRHRIRHLDALRPLLSGDVSTMRAAALRWVLQHELVSSAVIGPRSCVQLDQLVREAGKGPPYLPAETLEALEVRLLDVGARP
jgi:aryl-alcohol dehydrogenase-like predicted oxidoreductase